MKGQQANYNYGIALLKIIMCYEVVFLHYSGADYGKCAAINIPLALHAAPMFFLIAFFYSEKWVVAGDVQKFLLRIKKLLIPYVAWTIIYYIVLKLLYFFSGSEQILEYRELVYAFLFGHSLKLDSVLWFQWDLIIITALLFLLFKCCRNTKAGYGVLVIISGIAIAMQYTGINYNFFSQLPTEMAYPLGRLAEMLPYATIGMLLSRNLRKLEFNNYVAVAFIIIAGTIIYVNPLSPPIGFAYAGLDKMVVCVLLFIGFYYFKLDALNGGVRRFIKLISQYTMGIYCAHLLVGEVCVRANGVVGILQTSFTMSLEIFIGAWVVCLILEHLGKNVPGMNYLIK